MIRTKNYHNYQLKINKFCGRIEYVIRALDIDLHTTYPIYVD